MLDFTSASTWSALYVTSEWVIRLVMLVVVPFRRSPEAAKGWLLLVFFLVAIVAYGIVRLTNRGTEAAA